MKRFRERLAAQVAVLEAQLQRAGQGVEQERAEMEAVLLRLSNALAGVDVELTQSAVSIVVPPRGTVGGIPDWVNNKILHSFLRVTRDIP